MNIFNLFQVENLDLFLVGIVAAASGILGFIVFFSNPRSATNKAFLMFSLLTLVYDALNFLSYQAVSPDLGLWFIRSTIFIGTWHSFLFFLLAYIFPQEKIIFPWVFKFIIVPAVIAVSIITLTPLAFSGLREAKQIEGMRQIISPVSGFGMGIFGATVITFIAGGFYSLIRKMFLLGAGRRKQLGFIIVGALFMFVAILVFNFVLPAIFGNPDFVSLAPVFILPFLFFTAFAVARYHFLNVRIIATEVITFIIIIATFLEVLVSETASEMILRSAILGFLLVFGVLLIRSVRREVQQRESLEALTKELESANEALKKLDQVKSEFISIAGHQLRAPLTVIKGYVSMYLEGSLGAVVEKAKHAFQRVAVSTEQLIKLVSDLLDLSRIEAGKIQYEFVEDGIVGIVEEVVNEFTPKAQAKGLEIAFENAFGKEPALRLDRDKIREVIINLVDNAIKYSTAGRVLVKTAESRREGKKYLWLSVTDTGIGIKKEDLGRLFTKFVRTEEAKMSDPNGMGIGLYFVKRVVEDHGGRVWAESEGVGKGSAFFVELPIGGTNAHAE